MGEWINQYMSLFVGRLSDHSIQLETGLYARAGKPLDRARVLAHLRGEVSLATYLIDDAGLCKFAVMDADSENGFFSLASVQQQLITGNIPAWLERSRRGAHLWIFLARPVTPSLLRAWLLPFCPAGVEFYPKQSASKGYGSAIRLPFGIHRRSGRRYSFVEAHGLDQWQAVGPRVSDQVRFLHDQARAIPPAVIVTSAVADTEKKPFSKSGRPNSPASPYATIRDWCAAQDPFTLIGRYVDLDRRGGGRCPFSEHHGPGGDDHSFQVYIPGTSGGYCWYCYTWEEGGSVFDFLRHYHGLSARDLWQRIQRGGLW
jgi:hypothetical protein